MALCPTLFLSWFAFDDHWLSWPSWTLGQKLYGLTEKRKWSDLIGLDSLCILFKCFDLGLETWAKFNLIQLWIHISTNQPNLKTPYLVFSFDIINIMKKTNQLYILKVLKYTYYISFICLEQMLFKIIWLCSFSF